MTAQARRELYRVNLFDEEVTVYSSSESGNDKLAKVSVEEEKTMFEENHRAGLRLLQDIWIDNFSVSMSMPNLSFSLSISMSYSSPIPRLLDEVDVKSPLLERSTWRRDISDTVSSSVAESSSHPDDLLGSRKLEIVSTKKNNRRLVEAKSHSTSRWLEAKSAEVSSGNYVGGATIAVVILAVLALSNRKTRTLATELIFRLPSLRYGPVTVSETPSIVHVEMNENVSKC